MKRYQSLTLIAFITFTLGLSGLVIFRVQASGPKARWTQQIAAQVQEKRNTEAQPKVEAVSATFTPATGLLSITLNNNLITDPGGQQETVRLSSDAAAQRVKIQNSQNADLIIFGTVASPVTNVTINITGTNPNVAGLGGLVDMNPGSPGAGFGALNETVTLTGGAEKDTIIAAPLQALNVDGGGGEDTLIVNSSSSTTFNVTSANGGTFTPGGTFSNIENLTGGTANDTFNIASGGSLTGKLDGGANIDTLDYNAFATSASVNLGTGSTGLGGTIDGSQENPPQSATTASGTVTITNFNPVTKTFDISATVSNLPPASVTGFHIHRAQVGTNGAIIIDLAALFGLGTLVPAGTGFTFTATGVSLPAQHEAAFLGGITYFNVHTAAAPGGLIRGQIFSNGNVNLASGTATGTGGVSNVENAIGGSAADSLVGSFGINNLAGNAGNDTIVAGPGNDTLNGGDNNDVLVWSNGDNNDVLDGGLGTDVVQVNGSVTAGDVFTVGASGTRVAFARTNLVPFSLDIATTETFVVNGIGGDDNLTVNSLVGVADLSLLSLFGFDGADTFNLTPVPTGTILSLNANGGTPTTAPGDTLDVIAEAVTNPLLTLISGNGTFTSTSHQTINFTSIENTSPPIAGPTTTNVTTGGATTYTFTVTYTGDTAINVSTLGTGDVRILGPGGLSITPTFVSVDTNTNGTPRTATYSFTPPGGSWDVSDNGSYLISMNANRVADTLGNFVVLGAKGFFTVNVLFIVTNLNDAGAGSLRQAILNANANGPADTIFLQTFGTITLTSGELSITDNVTIIGPGAPLLTISGNNASRVFYINAGFTANLSGLTITGGKPASNESGGGITNAGTLNLRNCVVFGNTATGSGGGIYSTGNLDVTNCTIRNNTANGGGGIHAFGGSVNVFGSTISANTCAFDGGGLNMLNVVGNLTNTTISGNQANGSGGGVMFFSNSGSFTLFVSGCTIANNTGGNGGGLRTFTLSGAGNIAATTLRNSIIANNTAPNLNAGTSGGGAATITSQGFNLTSDNSVTFLSQATDQINKDPLMGPLSDNFNLNQTHALLAGSPAIDKGNSFGLAFDQRRVKRPQDDAQLPNAPGGDGADIGAFERSSLGAVSGASYAQNQPLAQESIVSLFGENIAKNVVAATAIPLPTLLDITSVVVRDSQNNDRPAPLFYVSPGQINIQVPPNTAIGAATIIVKLGFTTVASVPVSMVAVQPSLFSVDVNGFGYPAGYITRVKPDNSQILEPVAKFVGGVSVAVPIDLSNQQDRLVLVLYGTGIRNRSGDASVTINIGGTDLGVQYANLAPGFVGLDQINSVILPASLVGKGEVSLKVTVDGQVTNMLLLNFK